jgi:VEFS-Box of polycomb protein
LDTLPPPPPGFLVTLMATNEKNLDDYIDVEPKERELMKMWNRFVGCSQIPDKEIPSKFKEFLKKHHHHDEDDGLKNNNNLKSFEWDMYQMLITFWEHRLLSLENVEDLMRQFHQTNNIR